MDRERERERRETEEWRVVAVQMKKRRRRTLQGNKLETSCCVEVHVVICICNTYIQSICFQCCGLWHVLYIYKIYQTRERIVVHTVNIYMIRDTIEQLPAMHACMWSQVQQCQLASYRGFNYWASKVPGIWASFLLLPACNCLRENPNTYTLLLVDQNMPRLQENIYLSADRRR